MCREECVVCGGGVLSLLVRRPESAQQVLNLILEVSENANARYRESEYVSLALAPKSKD